MTQDRADSRPVLTLADWRAQVLLASAAAGATCSRSAADLVLEDRARH